MHPTDAYLRTLPLFRHLSLDVLRSLRQCFIERRYRKGTVIHLRGEPLDRIFILRSGKVKMHRTDPEGKRLFLSYHYPGELFPFFGFFHPTTFQADAQAVEDSTLLVITTENMDQLLQQHSELSIRFIEMMGKRIVDLEEQLKESVIYDVFDRLVLLLLRLSRTVGEPSGRYVRLGDKFTNRELAQMIGSTRETVSRILNRLKQEELVRSMEGHLELDVEKLRFMMEGTH